MSGVPSTDLNDKGMDVAAMFRRSVARTPDRDAVVDVATGRRLTYGELADRVYAVAHSLREAGIERGDHVAVCMANVPEHVILYLAVQTLGCVSVPFNFRLPSGKIQYHVEDAEADAFAFGPAAREETVEALDEIDVDPLVYAGEDPPADAMAFETLTDGPTHRPDVDRSGEELALILYTSGTTGLPKGVPIGRAQSVLRSINESYDQRRGLYETMIGVMPMYHTVGLEGNLGGTVGMSGTYLTAAEFDPPAFVEAIEREGVTALNETPAILRALLEVEGMEERDYGSVELVSYAGAPMSSALFERVVDVFDPDRVTNLYGATEAFEWLDLPNLVDDVEPIKNGPGNLMHEVRIVELDSEDPEAEVETGDHGEMILNMDSPTTFSGYWKKPEETEANVHDGWFFTGDVAYQGEDGYVYAVGRVGNMIISGGENIAPAEVEDVLAKHEYVADVAVDGVPDEEWGELVTAYVQLAADAPDDQDRIATELDEWCRDSDELADFKRPRDYRFIAEVPRNPSGKIVRSELPE